MKKVVFFLFIAMTLSCGRHDNKPGKEIITVSIEPFRYFVEAIGGNDFTINVMVPPGADPHVYEPYPDQVTKLSRSSAFISDGYMGFEKTWLNRFYETNSAMKHLALGDSINLISSPHSHGDEGVDPHFWVSPKSGLIMASSVKNFLTGLNPSHSAVYQANYDSLLLKIDSLDKRAERLFSSAANKAFMIFHPDLTYLARDYGLEQIPVEYEGKEPSPSHMRDLIDIARKDNIKVIFVQREFDEKAAKTIAQQVGAGLVTIDPLSGDWLRSTSDAIDAVYDSLEKSAKQQ
ncbi:MAG TPA: zinc ABC transporter substrate-binding protein [Bacteroidales bacterium]|nr:zinc ABC transporter substrate-binding protein [Bacteroidales bacterium]